MTTVRFVQELAKVNHFWTLDEANDWIAKHQSFFRDYTDCHGEDKRYFLVNVEAGIDLNKICRFGRESSRLHVVERYLGEGINSGAMLIIDTAIKPVDGHRLLARVDGEVELWRLITIIRRGLESTIDKWFISFGDEVVDDTVVF